MSTAHENGKQFISEKKRSSLMIKQQLLNVGVELRENTPEYCRLSPSALEGFFKAGGNDI